MRLEYDNATVVSRAAVLQCWRASHVGTSGRSRLGKGVLVWPERSALA